MMAKFNKTLIQGQGHRQEEGQISVMLSYHFKQCQGHTVKPFHKDWESLIKSLQIWTFR